MRYFALLSVLVLAGVSPAADKLRDSLLFYSSFDQGVNADIARGDGRLYTADSLARKKFVAGLKSDAVKITKAGGRFGGSLSFTKRSKKVVFYKGAKNIAYGKNAYAGSVSFWLKLTPNEDLPAGFVDPLQITDKKWNDAAIWVDFTKDNPRQFRLGVFSDFKFWNPSNRKYDKIPEKERPLVTVKKPPFQRTSWSHIAITYRGVNTPDDGLATLYIDGKSQGRLQRAQRFSWAPEKVAIMLGLGYVGGLDELAIFDRELSAAEVKQLHGLKTGLGKEKSR